MALIMKKGFTLVEILVAVSVFSVVVTSVLGLFVSTFQNQSRSLDKSYLLSNASYVAEYMSRALRMAKKDVNGLCIPQYDNYSFIAKDHIAFLSYNGQCQEFFVDVNGRLKIKIAEAESELLPGNIVVENLSFSVSGESQDDNLQPIVTFELKLSKGGESLDFQTTVSQRQIDIEI